MDNTHTQELRIAKAATGDIDRVRAYLPSNYSVKARETTPDGRQSCIIVGRDVAGWTLDGYVIPRLASGLIGCKEWLDDDDA